MSGLSNYTYATLKQAILDYTEVDSNVFTTTILDGFIMAAQNRINLDLPMDSDRAQDQGQFATDNNSITMPVGTLFVRGIKVFSSTANGTTTGSLTGCVRGLSIPFRGFTPPPTTASIHLAGAKLNGSRPITLIPTTFVNAANTTITETNSFLALVVSTQWGVGDGLIVGGGLQCTYGPLNDRA